MSEDSKNIPPPEEHARRLAWFNEYARATREPATESSAPLSVLRV